MPASSDDIRKAELRGGSFLERALDTPPGIPPGRWRVALSGRDLSPPNEQWVRGIGERCDVGLRLAEMIPVADITAEVREALHACPPYPGSE